MTSANPIFDSIGHAAATAKTEIREAEHWAGSLFQRQHHPQPRFIPAVQPSSSQPEARTVTTPQQPASVVDSLHAITGEIQANPLVARLVQRRIGARLTAAQADHFVALIADVEQSRMAAVAADPNAQQN